MARFRTVLSRATLSIAAVGGLVGASLIGGSAGAPTSTAAVENVSSDQSNIVTTADAKSDYQGSPSSVLPSKAEIKYLTQDWKGKRDSMGRPVVPNDVLDRLKQVTTEQAWDYLSGQGYTQQYAGGWKILHPDQTMVGRVLPAQYMPSSPSLEERMTKAGNDAGYDGAMNSWPIQMLQKGDVYVADGYGKMKDGTLIGGNLGTDIYEQSGNGVIFNGSARDQEELADIDGFNAYLRGWHPSYLRDMMLTSVNAPIRIGKVTVLPGDIVLAKREGTVFIPSYLAEDLVRSAEETSLRDLFSKAMVKKGKYTSGQLDSEWTPKITADFVKWLKRNRDDLPVSPKRVDEIIKKYSRP